jgi:four helix bundle protein
MNRASLSVMLNIAEGFLRRRDKETAQFLRYAFSSNGELKAGYYACQGRRHITNLQAGELIRLNESIARMLRRWQSTLDVETPDGPDALRDSKRGKEPKRTKSEGPKR